MIENKTETDQKGKEVLSESSILMIIRGLPGSGKTRLAKELGKRMGEDKAVLLDPDYIDKSSEEYTQFVSKLAQENPSLNERFYVYRYLMKQARDSLRSGKIVIWDQPFTDLWGLKRTIESLENYATIFSVAFKVVIIELEATEDLARGRIARRASEGEHGLTEEKMTAFLREYKSSSSLGYQTIRLDAAIESKELAEEVIALLNNND